MIKFEKYSMPVASLGGQNPLPDIKNISYIHAGYTITDKISDEEKTYFGKGMISTMLPYMIQDGYDRNKKTREFNAAILENDKLKVVFLPELGGRLWSIFDKTQNRELLYKNTVFQPGNLALRNAWFSGGVEFNVGIKGHNPLTCSPMWCSVDKIGTDEVLRLYEYERIRNVVYSISAYLPDGSDVLYLKCRIENKSHETKNMYWWSNIAVPETKETRVIVPANEAFLSFYNEDSYLIDKVQIPYTDGTDTSYPDKISSCRDFFYKIPKNENKWIASADKDGYGLIQCSTSKLYGRKLFVWGQGQGGRHWGEWLSEKDSSYIEIQAGLAHTQMEHIPMPADSVWEWTEAYTALDANSSDIHGEYDCAVDAVKKIIDKKIGNPDMMSFPDDNNVTESEIIYKGSDWGSVEEALRKEKISDLLSFPAQNSHETSEWRELLEKNTFPCPDVSREPISYVADAKWLKNLESLPEQNWYSLLHTGIIKYALNDITGAKSAWEDSNKLTPNPWSLRNISMIYKNELGDTDNARKYIIDAFNLKRDCPSLCKEVAAQLTSDGNDSLWIDIFNSLDENIKKEGRILLYCAVAFINLGRFEEASQILNKDFVMNDIKEGELSVSHYWFELYRRIYAKENGIEYDPENADFIRKADEKYPLPRELDFRMHE